METFTLDPRRWRVARIVGRNPLLRRTDRVEALVVLATLLASIALVPISGVVGAVTYGHRQSVYTQEAHERHRVLATVSEVLAVDSGTTVVQARWPVSSGERGGPGKRLPGNRWVGRVKQTAMGGRVRLMLFLNTM